MSAEDDVRILDQRSREERERPFLPGMRRTWLLPLYDVCARLAGVPALHQRAIELADIRPGQSVVDVGCGTGNLSFAALAAQPDARVTGLDPDGSALRRAARKARRRHLSMTLVQGYADRIHAEDSSLDHVVSSLALHHVDADGRAAFAEDAFRALRPGGRITILDLDGPHEGADAGHHSGHGHGRPPGLRRLLMPRRSRGAQGPRMGHSSRDSVLELLSGAGFVDAREVDHLEHRLGRVMFVQATRPGDHG